MRASTLRNVPVGVVVQGLAPGLLPAPPSGVYTMLWAAGLVLLGVLACRVYRWHVACLRQQWLEAEAARVETARAEAAQAEARRRAADAEQLEQVILNVLAKVGRSAPPGIGAAEEGVTMHTASMPGGIRLSVVATGVAAEAPDADRAGAEEHAKLQGGTVEVHHAEGCLPDREVDFLSGVRDAIAQHLADPDFGVDGLAGHVDVSRAQLTRRLRGLIDEAPGSLIRRTRLERAAQLLRTGGATVKEVAGAVGYRSVPHFTEAFGKHFGVPPATYAQHHENGTPVPGPV